MAGLVGCEAGFSLWLRKAVRGASAGKAVVKCVLTWSAKGRAADQEVGWLGLGVAALGVVQSASGVVGRWPFVPAGCFGAASPSAPLLLKVFPRRGLAKVVGFPAGVL